MLANLNSRFNISRSHVLNVKPYIGYLFFNDSNSGNMMTELEFNLDLIDVDIGDINI